MDLCLVFAVTSSSPFSESDVIEQSPRPAEYASSKAEHDTHCVSAFAEGDWMELPIDANDFCRRFEFIRTKGMHPPPPNDLIILKNTRAPRSPLQKN